MLSVLSILIGQSTLRFLATSNFGMSWLAVGCLTLWLVSADNSLQAALSVEARAETNQFTETFLQLFHPRSNWT